MINKLDILSHWPKQIQSGDYFETWGTLEESWATCHHGLMVLMLEEATGRFLPAKLFFSTMTLED